MNTAYSIMTVDDSRAQRKKAIRAAVDLPEITDISWVDARRKVVAWRELEKRPWFKIKWRLTWGELGVWLSAVTAWEYLLESDLDALIVFEDDAIIEPTFNDGIKKYLEELPDDWDAVSLFVPENQRGDYYYNVTFNSTGDAVSYRRGNKRFHDSIYRIGDGLLCRTYQGYCNVAMMYSKSGAQKLLDLTKELGSYTPVDCFVFQMANLRRINAYSPHPRQEFHVSYPWNESPTLVHDGNWFFERGTK